MKTTKIFLSGAMSGLSLEEQNGWRKQIIDTIREMDWCTKKASFFNPVDYDSLYGVLHRSEREVMEFNLHNLRKSDVVIVNLSHPNSIGMAMEVVLAKEYRIPIIGFNADYGCVHPWLLECCTKICDNINECVDCIADFYLN